MRLTTTFTSIGVCALFITATLTSTTIATDQQQSGNSLAYHTPQYNGATVRSHFTSRRIERRRRMMMVKRYQEEPEEEDDEEGGDEDHSSSKSSYKHTTGGGDGDRKIIENTADPTVHTVTQTGDKVLGVANPKDPLSPAGEVLSGGRPKGTSASGHHKEQEDEEGEERRDGEA